VVKVDGGGHKERVKESEYAGNTMYSCIKREQVDPLKLFKDRGRGDK
jgi:hypothetical protein